ncbi:MAG: TIGR02266 family protein [Myxococcales bacterium]|nr:TIGR02266 family protein [Myxococcales bacterium]
MDPNTRQAKRAPVTLKIKFKSATLDQFIERYAADVSPGGIFIRTKEPLAVGTQMRFEFQLRDATPLITGDGTVVWTRENDPTRPNAAPGMGVRFDRLGDGSQPILDRILAEKARHPSGQAPITEPPPNKNFMDAPTRVAPSPLMGALAGEPKPKLGQMAPSKAGFADERTDNTPLPRPMPFHSDADEFPEETFEEATKVRSLEELVAATAAPMPTPAPAPTPAAEPPPRATPRAIAATEPTEAPAAQAVTAPIHAVPVPVAPPAPVATPATPPPDEPAIAAAKAAASRPAAVAAPATAAKAPIVPAKATATPAEPTAIPTTSSKGASAVVIGLLLAAIVAAGVWFFVLRKHAGPAEAPTAGTASGSQVAAIAPDAAVAPADAAELAPDAAVEVETEPTVIKANVPNATVEVVETGASGPVPFTADLEVGKAFTIRISAPGFLTSELQVTGGDKTASAKLEVMSKLIHVTSTPAGADIAIDGVSTGKVTPADVPLTRAQAAKSVVRVYLRKRGFSPWTGQIATGDFAVEGDVLAATANGELAVRTAGSGSGSSAGSDSGSDTGSGSGSSTGSGSGSATPTGTGSGSGAGTGTGTGSGSGSGSARRRRPARARGPARARRRRPARAPAPARGPARGPARPSHRQEPGPAPPPARARRRAAARARPSRRRGPARARARRRAAARGRPSRRQARARGPAAAPQVRRRTGCSNPRRHAPRAWAICAARRSGRARRGRRRGPVGQLR